MRRTAIATTAETWTTAEGKTISPEKDAIATAAMRRIRDSNNRIPPVSRI